MFNCFVSFRPLRECDILTPDQGRQVAKEINAHYYETSVLTGFGVNEVFKVKLLIIKMLNKKNCKFFMLRT